MLNKFRKNSKKNSIIPKLEIYLPVLIFNQNLQSYSTSIVLTTSVRRIFERGAGNLRIMKIKRKISPLRISPFSCPKLGEDQKNKVFSQILSVFVLKLSAQVAKGGGGMPQFCILFYVNYTVLTTQRGGCTMPSLNTPLVLTSRTNNIVCMR